MNHFLEAVKQGNVCVTLDGSEFYKTENVPPNKQVKPLPDLTDIWGELVELGNLTRALLTVTDGMAIPDEIPSFRAGELKMDIYSAIDLIKVLREKLDKVNFILNSSHNLIEEIEGMVRDEAIQKEQEKN